ncbi:MAG: divalent-cation tolerance protein CutA [Methylobacteriaceae bacterium]|nr:divalent-cation tolerance protein CutA [Methylobacteriaceae bacterium]MBV9395637.1 divalent-cation tolerance protein CutA [Methylobacteriaceae bacterium]
MTGFCIVLTTSDTDEHAERIVEAVLQAKLAACLQLMPIRSRYVWEGKIARENEVLILIKAKSADYDDLAACIRAAHTYEVPEIVRLEIAAGAQSYLDWIGAVTR